MMKSLMVRQRQPVTIMRIFGHVSSIRLRNPSCNIYRNMTSTTNEGDPEISTRVVGGSSSDQDYDNKAIAQALAKSQCPIARQSLQNPAGLLFKKNSIVDRGRQQKAYDLENLLPKDSDNMTEVVTPPTSEFFIPQVKLHKGDGSERKRVLV